jgi:hypothetical protein
MDLAQSIMFEELLIYTALALAFRTETKKKRTMLCPQNYATEITVPSQGFSMLVERGGMAAIDPGSKC